MTENTVEDKEIDEKQQGIKAVLDKALQSYEKLPMLEIVFDRLVRLLTTSLRNLTSENVEISIKTFTSTRFGNFLETIPTPTLITVFKVIEWENLGLLIVDSNLAFSMVDVLFGGKKSPIPNKNSERTYTDIEQALVKQISEVILADLGIALDPISPANFVYDRMESNPNFATISRTGDAVILLQLKVDVDDREGQIDLLIPYATLEPIKNLLTQVFLGEKYGTDIEWEEKLMSKVLKSDITLQAQIDDQPSSVNDVMKLKVGQTIMLNKRHDDEIDLLCQNTPLCKGKLGQVENKLAFKITEFNIKK